MSPPASLLADVRRGQHVCLLYDEQDDPIASVAPFLASGIEAGERCVYVVGDHDPVRVRQVLGDQVLDLERATARGALVLVDRWEVSFPDGEFDPAAMIVYVREAIATALRDGFSGLRVVAEMTWALQMGTGHNKMIHYEALGDQLYPDEPLVAICLYDRSQFPAEVCQDAIRVHPLVAVGDATYDNVFFEPPGSTLDDGISTDRLDWMIGQLRQLREAERRRLEILREQGARAEAEAAAKAKDELLSVLAHELRTPLTATASAAELALHELNEGEMDRATLRALLESVSRQAGKQAKLIDQVLDAARGATRELPCEPAAHDLAELVREVIAEARRSEPGRPIELSCPSTLTVVADRLRIDQLLGNLIDNAMKFSPPGSRIDVEVSIESDREVVLSVRDRGAGIPPEDRERVFERYYQGQGGAGLGLGLHLCREISRMHGGDLHLESPPDGGSRFYVRLVQPAASTAAPE